MKEIKIIISIILINFFLVDKVRAADIFVCHQSGVADTCEAYDATHASDYISLCANSGQLKEIITGQTCSSYVASQAAIKKNQFLNLEQNVKNDTKAFLDDKKNFDPSFSIKSNAKSTLNPSGLATRQEGVFQIIRKIINFLVSAAGMVTMIMYIWAGVLWMSASGNSENVGKAQTILAWTTIGLVVTLSSYIILNFVLNTVLAT